MRRTSIVVGLILLAVVLFSIADLLLRSQHPCARCGAEMQPFENASSIYVCPECEFMVDTSFEPPAPGH